MTDYRISSSQPLVLLIGLMKASMLLKGAKCKKYVKKMNRYPKNIFLREMLQLVHWGNSDGDTHITPAVMAYWQPVKMN